MLPQFETTAQDSVIHCFLSLTCLSVLPSLFHCMRQAFMYTFIQSCSHSLTICLIERFIHCFARAVLCSLFHVFPHSFLHPSFYSFIPSPILLFIHPFIHPCMQVVEEECIQLRVELGVVVPDEPLHPTNRGVARFSKRARQMEPEMELGAAAAVHMSEAHAAHLRSV